MIFWLAILVLKKLVSCWCKNTFGHLCGTTLRPMSKVSDVCLASKAVRHNPYNNCQSLPVSPHRWKNLSIDFMTGLPILTDWKRDSYDSILVIVDWLIKMVYQKPVKITINVPGLAEVIINLVIRHYGLLNSIVTDRSFLFTSKFWSLLFHFFGIKRRLFTAFYSQTDGQIKRQNSTIEVYLRALVNFKQNNWAKLLPMAKSAYNKAKNTNTGYMPFELNCGYYSLVFYEKDINPCSKSTLADELSAKLQKLIIVCQENLYHAQELQKQAHNKGVKRKSYAPGDKIWLNSKYLKTKQNRKLEAKFFRLFQVLHPVGKQAYKLKLPKKWRIHDIFDISLLKQDTTRKERVDKKMTELDFEFGNSKEYEVEGIWGSAVYVKESESHLPSLYYLVAWKGYLKKKITWELILAVQHLRKLISSFYKNHPKKPIAISPPVDFAPPMAKPTVKLARLIRKQKQSQPVNSANKWAKKNWTFYLFSHVTSSRPRLLGFIETHWFFSLKSSYQVKRFFINNKSIK